MQQSKAPSPERYHSFLTGKQEIYSRSVFLEHLAQLIVKYPTGIKVGASHSVFTTEHIKLVSKCVRRVSLFSAEVKDCIMAFLALQYMMPPNSKVYELYESAKCIQDQVVAWADGSVSSLEQLKAHLQSVNNKRLDTLVKVVDLRIRRMGQREVSKQGILLNLGKNHLFTIQLQDITPPRILQPQRLDPQPHNLSPTVTTRQLQHHQISILNDIQITIISPEEAKDGKRKRSEKIDTEERPTKRCKASGNSDRIGTDEAYLCLEEANFGMTDIKEASFQEITGLESIFPQADVTEELYTSLDFDQLINMFLN